ncbi:hypothetical protein D3C85_809520 [compost metagenome]
MVEVGVYAKVHELHAPRLAQLGVLLVEGGDGAAQVVEAGLERLEIGAVIGPFEQGRRLGIGAARGSKGKLGGEVLAVEAHQQILGRRRQAAGEGHGPEQIPILGVAGQVGAYAEPEIIQPPLAPVGGLDEAAAKLDGLLQPGQQSLFKPKQGVAVEAAHPLARQQLGHGGEAVSPYDIEAGRIPEDEVVVVIVEGIEIPPPARAFPHGAKRDFPQPPQFAQNHRMALLVAAIEQDALAIRGLPEQLAAIHGLFELAAILRQGDGGLGRQGALLPLAEAIEMAAHQGGGCLGGELPEALGRDALPQGEGDAPPLLAKQLAHQQQGGGGLVEPGGEIEGEAVAPVQMDGHQRRAGAPGQLDEAPLPGTILHPLGAEARHLAGGEDDEGSLLGQVLPHGQDGAPVGLAPQVVHRQQQGAQGADLRQQLVGHYLDVGADAAEQAQQGQPVQGSYGVVRDYHDPAAGGDVLELGLAHPVVKIEGAEGLLDEVQAAQVRMALGKLGEGLLVEQPAQPLPEQGTDQGLGGEAGQMLPQQGIDVEHGQGSAKRCLRVPPPGFSCVAAP